MRTKALAGPTDPRFWDSVDRSGPCWLWLGRVNGNGYGRASLRGGRQRYAHLLSYEQSKGPVPDGRVIDHLCRNPRCVNPAHLEPVTQRTNTLRGNAPGVLCHRAGTCKRGHPVTPENTYHHQPPGAAYPRPSCRVCRRLRRQATRQGYVLSRSRWEERPDA